MLHLSDCFIRPLLPIINNKLSMVKVVVNSYNQKEDTAVSI
jgi:hypothetical protein